MPPDWRQRVMQDIEAREGPLWLNLKLRSRPKHPGEFSPGPAAGLVVIVGWLILANLDWYDPWITLKPDLPALGSHAAFWLEGRRYR